MAEAVVEAFTLLDPQEKVAIASIVLAFLATAVRPWHAMYRRSYAGVVVTVGRIVAPVTSEIRSLFQLYDRIYAWIAGAHPERNIWHCQWLSVKDLYRELRRILPTLQGQVLDVGCRGKPYARWLTAVDEHVGIDVTPGATVDHVIRDGQQWPLPSETFQSVLCTHVLGCVRSVPHAVSEIDRVLEVGGIAVIETGFCYNDMSVHIDRVEPGIYKDYWRHSFYGVQELFAERFEIIEARRHGGFGSTAGVMLLNWVGIAMSRSRLARLLMVALLPAWLLFSLLVNLAGWLIDKLDRTDMFYHSVFLVVRKKER